MDKPRARPEAQQTPRPHAAYLLRVPLHAPDGQPPLPLDRRDEGPPPAVGVGREDRKTRGQPRVAQERGGACALVVVVHGERLAARGGEEPGVHPAEEAALGFVGGVGKG